MSCVVANLPSHLPYRERCPSFSLGVEKGLLVIWVLDCNGCYKPGHTAGIWAQEPASTRSQGPAAPTFIDAVLSFSKIGLQSHLTQCIPKSKAKQKSIPLWNAKPDHTKCKAENISKMKSEEPWQPKSQKGDSCQVILKHTMQVFPNPDLVKILSFFHSTCPYPDVVNF